MPVSKSVIVAAALGLGLLGGSSAVAAAPAVTDIRQYLIIGMRPGSAGEAVTVGSSQELGADRQTLSGGTPSGDPDSNRISPIIPNITPTYPSPSSPNLRDVYFPDSSLPTDRSKNRWLWDDATGAHYFPDAARLIRGVDWSGDIAVTSPGGKFSLQDINLFGQFGIRARNQSAPAIVSNSNYFDDPSLTGVLMDSIDDSLPSADVVTKGWDGGVDLDPLLADLRLWRTFIRGLPRDTFFNSGNTSNPRDLFNRTTINAGGALTGNNTRLIYDINGLDTNGDGYAVIDIGFDGTDFEVYNSDFIIIDSNLANGTPFPIFRIRGGANMRMSNASILAGDGLACANNGLGAIFVKVHPEEEFTSTRGSSDTVFRANNLVVNRIGFWDLNTIGDANLDTDYPAPSDAAVYLSGCGGFPGSDQVVRGSQSTYTQNSVNNGQGCGQWISPFVNFQNVRFMKCSQCLAAAEDAGDLPDTSAGVGSGNYQTLLANNGPRHTIVAGFNIGTAVDAEANGQPNAGATGDDAAGTTPDDEDGVAAFPTFISGTSGNITVSITNPAGGVGAGTLYGFIDWNNDGSFAGPNEITSIAVPDGSTSVLLPYTAPAGAVTGVDLGLRLRLTTDVLPLTDASSMGLASNGEVEDYVITVVALDFGDAPTAAQSGFVSSYPTTLADNGARHVATGPTLGPTRDAELDGQPNVTATGDGADEDGVTIPLLSAGQSVTLTINASGAALVDAWIDWNADGDWNDAGEQIATSLAVAAGNTSLSVAVPCVATCGFDTYARFRVSTAGGLAPTGVAANGEVEDYQVTINDNTPPVLT